ncbi:MFS transporter [Pseudomonas alliivorans]|uniref:NTP/NDP exchange transporter n=1 Tax=Pseudomonas alliivorans TaxID=2810613 RepID=UPI001AE7645F|nr:MFS transporter [Pseudomonas alliivorans]MBP0942776.1 MFS transporter [Pseudomonas alliivorans]MEE4880870.1 MFS transporter [Pseudomonas alliivorans]MEE4932267.1 MFS transporter [Pseudomonas alliivorans]MEE4937755.1 MFS transporter [Pseudomonas alliivorans]MEE4942809.1 MFS transporter [Pseudomonas alliivorans]
MIRAAALKWANVRPDERAALLLGFAFHFCVLASYYLVRPLRDALGLEGGADKLQWLFTATFVVMLLMVPLFGALVSRLPPRRFVPLIYRGIAMTMILFGVLIANRVAPVQVGNVFFVWISVYNLFIVSIFWSVLVDRFSSEQGERLFGFVAAGGTLGTFMGPLLAATLAARLGPIALTLAAAVLLELAVRCHRALLARTEAHSADPSKVDHRMGGSMLAGITLISRSPYLLGLVLFMLLHTTAATFLYFEQGRIVADSFSDVASRTRFFAIVDLIVSVLTLTFQLLLTGPLIRMIGVGGALIALPLATVVAFTAMALAPVPTTVALAQGLRRAVEFSVVRPAREVLWTVVSREEKYKAKNVIETLVYRGGDAISGWLSVGLAAMGAGFGMVATLILPVAGGWAGLCLWLAKRQKHKADASEGLRDVNREK